VRRGVPRAAAALAVLVVCGTLGLTAAPSSAAAPTISFAPRVVAPGGTVIVHNTDALGLCAPEPDRIDNISLNVYGPQQRIVGGATFAPNDDGNWSWSWTAPAVMGTYTVTVACGARFDYAPSSFFVGDPTNAQITGQAAMSLDGVREVQVDLDWSNYDTCSGGSSSPHALGFPNGECRQSVPVQVTNSGEDSNIFVETSPMVPSDASSSWQPCAMPGDVPSGPVLCDGPTATDGDFAGQPLPGADQFHQDVGYDDGSGTIQWAPVSSLPGCDRVFDLAGQGCQASPGQETAQYLRIVGPSSTTDESTTWSNTVTWVAMP